jgi:EmrB/QacA subfamily drug resistance transporter
VIDRMTGTEPLPSVPSFARLGTTQGRWIIGGAVLYSGIAFLSATVTNVALPSIGADLGSELAGLQWVVTAYLLAVASLILPGGSASDIFGRRRMLMIGIGVFAVGSLACVLSPTLPVLIAARLVAGAGAALMTPASLAIVDASFHPDDRSKAIAVWASGSAIAAGLGPLVGGYLVDALHWRWIFVLPLLVVAVAAVGLRHIPETRGDSLGRHLDLPSAGLALLAVAGLVYAVVQGPVDGFTAPSTVAAAAVGGVAGAGFVLAQFRRRDPMVPLRLFRSRQFSGANLFTVLAYCAIGGSFFFCAVHFQTSLGYTALAAGAAMLPVNVMMFVGSPRAGALSARYGPRWFVTVGPVVAAGGLATLAMVGAGDSYVGIVLPGTLLLGTGLAIMVGPLTASVFGAVSEHDVGIASGVNNAIARLGGLMGVAFLPYAAGVSGGDVASFSASYRPAMLIAAGLCVVCALVGYLTISRHVALHTHQQVSPTAECVVRSLPHQRRMSSVDS